MRSMALSISTPKTQLSFSKTLISQNPPFLSMLCFGSTPIKPRTTIIRMGGGPRTYPGGVSKWQWKRMQAKKAKQLLKARLSRERQIYEMRKRAELKAAVSELERPWEVVQRAPNLFSIKADEQLKVLADRFQKPGGFDLWSETDGPQLFRSPVDGLPSARFFPKGVVHSVKPYGLINGDVDEVSDDGSDFGDDDDDDSLPRLGHGLGSESLDDDCSDGDLGMNENIRTRNGGDVMKRSSSNGGELMQSVEFDNNYCNSGRIRRTGSSRNSRYSKSGDAALVQHGRKTNKRGARSLTGRGYCESRDGTMRQNGEFGTDKRSNDGRTRVSEGNTRHYDSRDGLQRQNGKFDTNRSSYDGRSRRSGGLRNSRNYESRGGVMRQDGEFDINKRSSRGMSRRSGGYQSSRYSVAGNARFIQDGETKMNRSRNSRYYESRDGASRKRDDSRTNRSRNVGRISKSGGLRNSGYFSESEVFDMSLQRDGSYEFEVENINS